MRNSPAQLSQEPPNQVMRLFEHYPAASKTVIAGPYDTNI